MTTEKMQRTDTLFIQLENKLQQLAMENKEGANSLKEKYTDLKKEADVLKKEAEQKLDQCKLIQNDCEKLESDLEEAKAWIKQTEDVLTNCENVDLDTNSMSRTIHKHDVRIIVCNYMLINTFHVIFLIQCNNLKKLKKLY